MIDQHETSGNITFEFRHDGAASRYSDGLDIPQRRRLQRSMHIDPVEDFADDVERRREIGPADTEEDAHCLADLCLERVMIGQRAGMAVEDEKFGTLVDELVVAFGLYEKSRRLETGERTDLAGMIFVKPRSGYQALFMGVMLLGLFLLWLRAAVLIYALFFGMVPFPGTDELIPMLFLTPTGWALLLTGSAVGALFAAFAFAISVFAVPMLLNERTDALSAMGISMAMVWANLPVMLVWGAIVMVLFALSVATAFIGLVIVFPMLGHATWHAYRAIRPDDRQEGDTERMFIRPAE